MISSSQKSTRNTQKCFNEANTKVMSHFRQKNETHLISSCLTSNYTGYRRRFVASAGLRIFQVICLCVCLIFQLWSSCLTWATAKLWEMLSNGRKRHVVTREQIVKISFFSLLGARRTYWLAIQSVLFFDWSYVRQFSTVLPLSLRCWHSVSRIAFNTLWCALCYSLAVRKSRS